MGFFAPEKEVKAGGRRNGKNRIPEGGRKERRVVILKHYNEKSGATKEHQDGG